VVGGGRAGGRADGQENVGGHSADSRTRADTSQTSTHGSQNGPLLSSLGRGSGDEHCGAVTLLNIATASEAQRPSSRTHSAPCRAATSFPPSHTTTRRSADTRRQRRHLNIVHENAIFGAAAAVQTKIVCECVRACVRACVCMCHTHTHPLRRDECHTHTHTHPLRRDEQSHEPHPAQPPPPKQSPHRDGASPTTCSLGHGGVFY
jgi:hypothetical protein